MLALNLERSAEIIVLERVEGLAGSIRTIYSRIELLPFSIVDETGTSLVRMSPFM